MKEPRNDARNTARFAVDNHAITYFNNARPVVSARGYTHFDAAFAAARQNDGAPETFSIEIARFVVEHTADRRDQCGSSGTQKSARWSAA
jgi:hypothetical protein